MPGTLASGGNILYAWLIGPTLAPTSVAANTTAEQLFTIGGLQAGDNVSGYLLAPMINGIGISNMRVSAANQLQIGFSNNTAGALVPTAGVYQICICRPESLPLPINAA